ncbi:glycoside hydrolase family 3 protein [Nocardia fluminea]|uniref:glycoside hydrolase family 3 protein n=1 Tax=Nocardia fluminea TaxID=134984 RepID=UPI0033CA74FB
MTADLPYRNPILPIETRVEDLLARMRIEDKVGLLFHYQGSLGDPEQPDQYGRSAVAELVRDRRITHLLVQGSPKSGRELAQWHNAVQRIALEHPLGIPVTISSDPRHGVTRNPLTSNESGAFSRWPEPIGIAAIGTEATAREYGDVTRREYLAAGIRVALHPQIDLATEPRWARIAQTFGEDADLTSRLVRAYLGGLQGQSVGPDSVAAMTKHFPGGGPQLDGLDPHFADGREQVYPGGRFDYHLEPFLAAIEAGTSQMMPYYGMPVGTQYEEVGFAFSKGVITELLRDELGFDGIVCTDFGVITGYGEAFPAKAWGVEQLSRDERMVKLLDAGVDQFGGENCTDVLLDLLRSGTVDEDRLDVSVRRLLAEKFRLGLFDDRRFVDTEEAEQVVGSALNKQAGVRAQHAALTLLRNGNEDPVLPLRRGISVYVEGMDPQALAGFATVVARPQDAEVAIIRTHAPSYHDPARGFLGAMHKGSLEFSPAEIEHLEELAATVPTVVDVYLERPAVLTDLTAAAALVVSFGTDDRPFAEVLFGTAAPRGRLPFDLPRSMSAVEASRSDVPFDTADPLFRFGFGLRYRDSDV